MNWADLQRMMWTGGPILVATKVLIVLGSIGSVVVAIERFLLLRGFDARAKALHELVVRALLRGDGVQARTECDRSQVHTAAIYRAALDRAAKPEKVPDAADRARREVVQELRGSLWTLATLGAVMPFVGLFGTVVGILASFAKLQHAGGTPGFAIVAGDISEALIVTAGGILVAVEAVVFYNYFQAKVAREAFQLGLYAEEAVELIVEKAPELAAQSRHAAPSAPNAPAGTGTSTTSTTGPGSTAQSTSTAGA